MQKTINLKMNLDLNAHPMLVSKSGCYAGSDGGDGEGERKLLDVWMEG